MKLLKLLWFKYRKAIGTAIGGVTATAITGAVEWSGLDLNPGPGEGLAPWAIVPLVGLFGLAGTIIAKPNLYGEELEVAADPAVSYDPSEWTSQKVESD